MKLDRQVLYSHFWEQLKRPGVISPSKPMEVTMLKGIALWAMGVPVFVIVLLYMFVF
jgi:hypothetical protein